MHAENTMPDSYNLVFVIKACKTLSLLRDGECAHCFVIKLGFENDQFVVCKLVDLYLELRGLGDARKVFDVCSERSLVLWSCMMRGCLKLNENAKVFDLFWEMRRVGVELDKSLLDTLVWACGNVLAGTEVRACHGYYVKRRVFDGVNLETSLVNAYLKCGLFDLSFKLFERISDKDVVLWTTMIAGFAKLGRPVEALWLFRLMLEEFVAPNCITFASVILACSHIGSLRQGKSVHCYMLRNGVELDLVNYTSLIDMYSKCGCVLMASRVFNQMSKKNVFSWSAMINGLVLNGLYAEAIMLFDQMRCQNQLPNAVTFVPVLSACSNSGRVEEGWDYLRSMRRDYGIVPKEDHYACMVDLLCRAGRMDEAVSLIQEIPINPGVSTWGALLSACRKHKRVTLAEDVAKKLLKLESDKSSVYILLLNIYAEAGMWHMVHKVMLQLGEKGFYKTSGFSSIEIDGKLNVLTSKSSLDYWFAETGRVWASLTEQLMEFSYFHDLGAELLEVEDTSEQ